jgi:hypothetical protein
MTNEEINQIIENEKKLRAAGAPWLNGKRYVPNIHESLKYRYKAGLLTLHEVAREYCRAGWTNYVDEQYALSHIS